MCYTMPQVSSIGLGILDKKGGKLDRELPHKCYVTLQVVQHYNSMTEVIEWHLYNCPVESMISRITANQR